MASDNEGTAPLLNCLNSSSVALCKSVNACAKITCPSKTKALGTFIFEFRPPRAGRFRLAYVEGTLGGFYTLEASGHVTPYLKSSQQ